MTDETLRKGDRVLPSVAGRTAAWPKRPGTVTRRLSGRTVEVQWDGTTFGDEMDLGELTRLGDEGDASAPRTDGPTYERTPANTFGRNSVWIS